MTLQRSNERSCGPCCACCTAMNVPALNKPSGQDCPHMCSASEDGSDSSGGCQIYHDRPSACRQWHCLWVRDQKGLLSDAHRPDQLGLFFSVSDDHHLTDAPMIHVHEIWPGALLTDEAIQTIRFFRQFTTVNILPANKRSLENNALNKTSITPLTINRRTA